MNRSSKSFVAAALLAASMAATPARAAGAHAGGHAHVASAIGGPGAAAQVSRTVRIDMNDAMRFRPSRIDARRGQTIRFVVSNSGRLKHELVIGTAAELKEHAEVMKKHPEMEHAEPNMVTLAPGRRGEVIWRFSHAGTVDFACLQPGHFDAGMKGVVKVAGGRAAAKPSPHAGHPH